MNCAVMTANPHSTLRAPMPTPPHAIAMIYDRAASLAMIVLSKVANAQYANPSRVAVAAPFIALPPEPAVMVLRAC
jgi:hypothetical protein